MYKSIQTDVWAFDAEWIPDVAAGKLLYNLPADMPDAEVMEAMWKAAGATEEKPRPYLKTVISKIISISMVRRTMKANGKHKLQLVSLPDNFEDEEAIKEKTILDRFISGLGEHTPQIVGYNSRGADMPILVQRGIANGLTAPKFTKRANNPWTGRDYFNRGSEWHIDLKENFGGWGGGTPSLSEIATVSGIPGKMDVNGGEVAPMWLEGRLEEIVAYNEYDALTTYLVWLRMGYFGGHFTTEEYETEQDRVRQLISSEVSKGKVHLEKYQAEWDRLKAALPER